MTEKILTDQHIEALALCGPDQVRALPALQEARVQRTVQTLNLLATYVDGGRATLREGALLLGQLPRTAHDEALGHPQASSWAQDCLNEVRDGRTTCSSRDLAQYRIIAAGAAIRFGQPFDAIEVPVQVDGTLTLPGLGRARFANSQAHGGDATVEHDADGLVTLRAGNETIHPPIGEDRDTNSWEHLRHLQAGHGSSQIRAELDDLSPEPYRMAGMGADTSPAARLSNEKAAAWQQSFSEAHSFLREYMPVDLDAAAVGLRSIVPLVSHPECTITRSPALGIIGLSAPAESTFFAKALVEEIQKGILRTLHFLKPLHNAPTAELRYRAPELDSPVSFTGLFSSLYGHASVIRTWAARYRHAASDPMEKMRTQINYELWRERYPKLIEKAKHSAYLTKSGKVLIETIEREQSRRDGGAILVDPEFAQWAQMLNLDRRLCWQLRNQCPDRESVFRLAHRWRRGQSCRDEVLADVVINDIVPEQYEVQSGYKRLALILAVLGRRPLPEASAADTAFAQRRYREAYMLYEAAIASNPADAAEAWAGFALLHTCIGDAAARNALQLYPEVVYAVHRTLHAKRCAPRPSELAAWLGQLRMPKTMEY